MAEGAPMAAQRLAQRLQDAVAALGRSPIAGRPGPSTTREWVRVRPYVIRYPVRDGRVFVVRIRHAARRPTE